MQLSDYDIDAERGFVPGADPLTALPARYAVWDEAAARLPLTTMTGRTLQVLAAMPVIEPDGLATEAELRRAQMLLAAFANAWMALAPEARSIPAPIAVPLIAVARRLGYVPITTHSTIVLGNWRRLDPSRPLTLENVDTLVSFRGSIDEKWFFLSTLGVELAGAPMLALLVEAVNAAEEGRAGDLAEALAAVGGHLTATIAALMRVRQCCDPHIFYHHVRPYLAGWPEPGVIYEGTGVGPVTYNGGSAAQSSLLQAVDAALGIVHRHALTEGFLTSMRDYMPPRHRAFIADLAARSRVRAVVEQVQGSPELRAAYDACVAGMDELRRKHIGLATEYITRQAANPDGALGTGGTHFDDFLRQARLETVRSKVGG